MTDTSLEALAVIESSGRADTLRDKAYDLFRQNPPGLTADEIAGALQESVLAVRPRITELRKEGLIGDTGDRRKNLSGRNAIVWRVHD